MNPNIDLPVAGNASATPAPTPAPVAPSATAPASKPVFTSKPNKQPKQRKGFTPPAVQPAPVSKL